MKRIILILTFFLVSLLAKEQNKLEVGFVYWKKDNAPEKYDAYVYGINKALDEINKSNSLLVSNNKLKLVQFNEKGSIEETIKIAKDIANRNNMIAVIGLSNSDRAIPSIEYISNKNIPIISSAGSKKIFENDTNDVFFTTNFGIYGEILYLQKFIEDKKYKKILFLSNKGDKYSDEYYDELKKILPNSKKIDSKEFINNTKNIKKSIDKNTLILISIDVENNAKYSKFIRENGINNDIFLGRGGIVGDEFYEKGGMNLKNIYELSTLLAGVSNETILKFKNDNKKFFENEKNEQYLEYAAYGYDAMNLINAAYLKGAFKETISVETIKNSIKNGLKQITEKMPYDGVATVYSFDDERVGGKLTPQYILETTGKKPTLYKKQYIYQNGILTYVPTLFTNIDIKSITINNQETSEYTLEMMVTLISEQNISLDDLEFENIVISNSSFTPSIYSKEFIVGKPDEKQDLNVKTYNVKALFSADNTIENFPFDSQKLPVLIKPKNPVDKNFINFFISDLNDNLNNIEISGWKINGGYAGFKKGNYEYISNDLEKKKEYYYRTSFTVDITRKALSSAIKFILPLSIVLLITMVLFAMPDNASADKVGSSTNMLITVAALYFTYATLVEVDYITYVDKFYMWGLGFVLITNVIFILRQRYYHNGTDNDESFNMPCFIKGWISNQRVNCKKTRVFNLFYLLVFISSIVMFIWAVIMFTQKAIF